ncbi:hypothetical protein [Priestia abyssalis]|uniref:hypothetical protein n=1 Tax=Priestia abyssalis TaxID=1221450 RepID=UPI002E2697AE
MIVKHLKSFGGGFRSSGILGFFTAKATYKLVEPPDPNVKPITIQVTSLDWK